jgi:hypothetical protein
VRKVSAELQFYNTKHLKIDGYNIPFREVGGTLLNASVTPFNGVKRMRLTGYNKQPKVTLLSDLPLPITLLSLTTEIKFGTGKIQDAG